MLLEWMQSSLTNRHQQVVIGDPEVDEALAFDVPQGSVLGPVMFSLYTTQLLDIDRKCGVSFHANTGDHQNYLVL